MADKRKPRPWENVSEQLGFGKSKKSDGERAESVQSYETSKVKKPDGRRQSQSRKPKDPAVAVAPFAEPELEADHEAVDYDALRLKYGRHGGYHWMCLCGECYYAKTNRASCPSCGQIGKDSQSAIYDPKRVRPGEYDPYRGGQTWTKSANGQMAKAAAKLLRTRVQNGGTVPQVDEPRVQVAAHQGETVVGEKPTRYFIEWVDNNAYNIEMERVGGDEDSVDMDAVTLQDDAANIAAAKSKRAKILADGTGSEVKIIERRDLTKLKYSGGDDREPEWSFERHVVEE